MVSTEETINQWETRTIYTSYDNLKDGGITSGFCFNEGMLFTDAREFSTDLVKASVELACQAYGVSRDGSQQGRFSLTPSPVSDVTSVIN